MSDAPPTPPKPKWTGAAIAFMAIGLLIFIPSGLCTSVFGIGALLDGGSNGPNLSFLFVALVVGGIPVLIGFIFIRLALKERKRG
ncbi:MAG: hypothetical protein WBQ17_15505 [Rhizomicrobium sp.]